MEYPYFKIDDKLQNTAQKAMLDCEEAFKKIDEITEYNQQKVLAAFIKNGVSEIHFAGSTGYGYGDIGREKLDRVFADSVGAEDALVRHSFASGTHTLAVALFGLLRPNDTMLCITGSPYDTIHSVIGLRGNNQGSLKDFGVKYKQVELLENGEFDEQGILNVLDESVKLIYIQRSRGYTLRNSLSSSQIGKISKIIKENSNAKIMVDNCYGEFVEKCEPLEYGADIIAGSLIKNAGGGIAKTGGYIAGNADLVELCSYRMTTPGLGREIGATLSESRNLFMGLFNAPHVTGEALKTAVFAAGLFELLGFDVTPSVNETRHDIIQAIKLKEKGALIAFCQGMQKGAPVDSFVVPEAWDMPGYDDQVIMSAGAFTMGSSIELSSDAPLRDPYAVWMQGGLNFHSAKMGVMLAAQEMLARNIIRQ